MKRYRGSLIFIVLVAVCAVGFCYVLRETAEYPVVGEAVFYPVNEVDGLALSVETSYVFTNGYTIRYDIASDSAEAYELKEGPDHSFENLEVNLDGQWYRLMYTDELIFDSSFELGGNGMTDFSGSVVQRYAGYGNRLESGLYRLTIRLTADDGTEHYLAAEFTVG